jgi:preprotein translocase subunit SecA
MNTIWSDFARMIFHVEVEIDSQNGAGDGEYELPERSASATGGGRVTYSGGVGTAQPSALAAAAAGGGMAAEGYAEVDDDEALRPVQQRRVEEHETLGRNDPCWCGSGKKFKKCHGA